MAEGTLGLETVWTSLIGQARAAGKSADMPGLVALFRERAEQKQLPMEERRRLAALLHGFAELAMKRGDAASAATGFAAAADYFREADDQSLLQSALGHQAEALMALDDFQGAMPLVAERARICRELDDRTSLMSCLSMQAKLLHWAGDAEHAAEVSAQQEALARELGGDDSVALALTNRALLLMGENKLDESEPLLEQAVQLLRAGANQKLLANTLGSLGVVIMQRGNLEAAPDRQRAHFERALELQRESCGIATSAGDHEGIAKSLAMQAMLLGQMGRPAEGIPLARKADTVARGHGLTLMANQMIAPVLQLLGAPAEDPPSSPRPAAAAPAAAAPARAPAAPAAPRAPSAEEEKADYLFRLNQWQKLSFLQRLKTKKPELPPAMRSDWRTDPILRGRFLKDFPDDIEVLVHDGHPGLSERSPERIWVRVTGRRGETWTGVVLNQPHQLQSVNRGSEITFVARSRTQPLVQVTPPYLEERKVWTVGPCDKCGLTETFSPPSALLAMSDAPPAARAGIRRLTAPCPVCPGMQILTRA